MKELKIWKDELTKFLIENSSKIDEISLQKLIKIKIKIFYIPLISLTEH